LILFQTLINYIRNLKKILILIKLPLLKEKKCKKGEIVTINILKILKNYRNK
jgi:hypothetical protein